MNRCIKCNKKINYTTAYGICYDCLNNYTKMCEDINKKEIEQLRELQTELSNKEHIINAIRIELLKQDKQIKEYNIKLEYLRDVVALQLKDLEEKDKVIETLKEMCYTEIQTNSIPAFQFMSNMDTATVGKIAMANKILLKILDFENKIKE